MPAPGAAQVAKLQQSLLAWYAACRRDLAWRRTRDPWAIWVSEIMLQQTRVDTVTPYFERFMAQFPTPLALAEAAEDRVLAAWSGLGYYRRARMLHAGARAVAESGVIPGSRAGLLDLPGIGPYTAGAIASIAFGERVGLVDGNVARVFARLFAIDDDMKRGGFKKAEKLAEELVPAQAPGEWNQALMELGATVCTPRAPDCKGCPVRASCRALAEGRVEELPVIGPKTKPKPQAVQSLVARDARDGRGRILLARRHSTGLFGGLWEPPSVDGGEEARDDLFARVPLASTTIAGRVTHVLSHRRLDVTVHVGVLGKSTKRMTMPTAYEAHGLFREDELAALGISTLARKVMAAAGYGRGVK